MGTPTAIADIDIEGEVEFRGPTPLRSSAVGAEFDPSPPSGIALMRRSA